ncbi:MAG: hypothetical protein ACTSYC_02685 [Promethearchaeota archaeon]
MESQYARQRTIEDIMNDDVNIQITGYVKEILNNNQIILKDNTGEIKIDLGEVEFPYKKNDLINVIGELNITMAGEKFIQAKIIQDMRDLNFEYYEKLYKIKKEFIKPDSP